MTGVPQPTISLILNGKRQVSSIETYEKFAEGLDIPRERLGLAAAPSPADQPAEGAPGSAVAVVAADAGPDRRTVLAAVGVAAWAIDEELDEVTRRMQLFAASNVDDASLEQLEASAEVVGRRAKNFLTTAAPWRTVPEIANVADAVKAWRMPTA
ncbi:hypothetical protein FF36_04197 [Frankia torreyi]|uniref:HTH cro/C1-type domain-containing protein n=1 Tax=Frankia torreyi TaxID=1856 RepID=A0A0D8BC22_9ACTN|nr:MULTISPECIES: helix-turn-helix transcriptional regulator [Frankia]KJE21509.1 hypothetical protein FF36_04197 [Frankia torreyi]KQM03496.1 hypothetical protein FF86_103921 [Frankia sp. CpI1-P]